MAHVTLTKTFVGNNAGATPQSVWAFELHAIGHGIPSEIFVFKETDGGEQFTNIAALYELADLSTKSEVLQNPNLRNPYYRKSMVSLVFPCKKDMDATYEEILSDIKLLVDQFNHTNSTDEQTVTEIF